MDSIRIEQLRSDSLKRIDGSLAKRGILESGYRENAHKIINEHFDSLLTKQRTEILRREEDSRLQLESIRETGIILKLD